MNNHMTGPVVECVPNFSEGRDGETLARLADAARSVPGAKLLDWSADRDHNRSVFTLCGTPEALGESVFRMAATAAERIDLRTHRGVHPRMGAADVIPFVPLRDADMELCVALAKALGARLWAELGIPVFFYEEAASDPARRDLAVLRRGQFEGMAEKIQTPGFHPDCGDRLHPTAGITAVGARGFLVAYNLYLDTADISVAKAVARAVRESSGGLRAVKAIGIPCRGTAQVSCNVTDVTVTPLNRLTEAVRREAARHGAAVADTEVIGLLPEDALQQFERAEMVVD